jgi:tetratricopeptide (TPR) repeat protein
MRQAMRFSLAALAAAAFLGLAGCSDESGYYMVGGVGDRRVLHALFARLDGAQGPARFTLIKTISEILARTGNLPRQILFLTRHVEQHPDDPYNSVYLLMVAKAYEDLKAVPFAVHYYDRILKNHPDLIANGGSVHYLCLTRLLDLVSDVERRIEYTKEMIARFGDLVDVATYWYYLATDYEAVGAWDQSIQAYKRFLRFPDARIPGRPDVHAEITQKVAFYDSNKDWTVPDLQFLVSEVRDALLTQNLRKLNQYKARNFFSKYWGQRDLIAIQAQDFDILEWVRRSRVQVATELEPQSNAREAFLKTTNWFFTVTTWYLYFRRVDFPADPEIDGRWEWAGVYFGDGG